MRFSKLLAWPSLQIDAVNKIVVVQIVGGENV